MSAPGILCRSIQSALVVEGGAMRGVFSAGVLDGFLEKGFDPFHFYIGVSAGAGNIAAYLAEMHGRNRRIYTEYSVRPEFISILKFLRGGHLMDLDWLWDVTISKMRLDLKKIYSKGRPLVVGLTDVETGRAVYRVTVEADLEHTLKASSALPVFYRGFPLVEGRPMTDGGVSSPIPVSEAVRRGARRIMVIRSRPNDHEKKRDSLFAYLSWFLRPYPALRETVRNQHKAYQDALSLIQNPPPGVSVTEVCPRAGFRTGRLSRKPEILREGYEQGRASAPDAIARWESHL